MRRVSEAWIFVSHSVKDLETVRKIRNKLESLGANPILFFLKSVREDGEIEDLLKREIEARQFFLLCDSRNAQESPWVQKEVEFVKSLRPRKYVRYREIWIADPWEKAVEELLGNATVFLSYAAADRALVAPYIDFLVERDFAIFTVENADPGRPFREAMTEAVRSAAETGALIAFLTPRFAASQYAREELRTFLAAAGSKPRIIPLLLEEIDENSAEVDDLMAGVAPLDFRYGSLDDHRRLLLTKLSGL